MSRPKGSNNKKTVEQEKTQAKTKEDEKLKDDPNYEYIKQLNKKQGIPIPPKYVLKSTDWLYTTCDIIG